MTKHLFDYIRDDVLGSHLSKGKGLLVVYDSTTKGLFHEPAKSLAEMSNGLFLDNTSRPVLELLKAAGEALAAGLLKKTIVYLKRKPPVQYDDRVLDPFQSFAVIGATFPAYDADDYLQICYAYVKALGPDAQRAVREVFASDSEPDFQKIDVIMPPEDREWIVLKGVSGRQTEADILRWILVTATDDEFAQARSELMTFAQEILGTKVEDPAAKPEKVREALWRATLMTAFRSSCGEHLPQTYREVPSAPPSHSQQVQEVLQAIRESSSVSEVYRRRALQAEETLHIADNISALPLDATADTFRAEVIHLQRSLVSALENFDATSAEGLLKRLKDSVWMTAVSDDPCELFETAIRLIIARENALKLLRKISLPTYRTLIEGYAETISPLDGLERQFAEQMDRIRMADKPLNDEFPGLGSALEDLSEKLHASCREVQVWTQTRLLQALEHEDWPPADIFSNTDVFDTLIRPTLDDAGNAVALIIVDAMRYEVGTALRENLIEMKPSIQAACAPLPSITDIGKAVLLPGGNTLQVTVDPVQNTIVPMLAGETLPNNDARMAVLKRRFGDRFRHMTTKEYLGRSRRTVDQRISLLVLRHDDLDLTLEQGIQNNLDAVKKTLSTLREVVRSLSKTERFNQIYIVSDHGFLLNFDAAPEDRCHIPPGSWTSTHGRMLLGDGTPDEVGANVVIPAAKLGIRTNMPKVAFPRALLAYTSNQDYFHGGFSLQETVVPVITIRRGEQTVTPSHATRQSSLKVTLQPVKPKVTTLRARIILLVQRADSLYESVSDEECAIRIEVVKKGTLKPAGDVVNRESGLVNVVPGEELTFRVQVAEPEDGLGHYTVRALDPETNTLLATADFDVEVTL